MQRSSLASAVLVAATVTISLVVGLPCRAQELPGIAEEQRHRDLAFAIFESLGDTAKQATLLPRIADFRHDYPQSLYLDRVLRQELDILVALERDCDDLRPTVQTLVETETFPLEAVLVADDLLATGCFDLLVADILITLDPPIEKRSSDDIADYHRVAATLLERNGEYHEVEATLLNGLTLISTNEKIGCSARLNLFLKYVASETSVSVEDSFTRVADACE